MRPETIGVLQLLAIAVGASILGFEFGWKLGLGIGLLVWAMMPIPMGAR